MEQEKVNKVEQQKVMTAEEFRNSGLLQEVNRQFFHPRGLALSVEVDNDGIPTNICNLLDYRDDEEGVLYHQDLIDPSKIFKVAGMKLDKLSVRLKHPECNNKGIQKRI